MGQGGAPEPVWTGAENFAVTGIRPPDLLARNVAVPTALYRPPEDYEYVFR